MADIIFDYETIIRAAFFFGVLALVMASEAQSPRRTGGSLWLQRWINNLCIALLNTIVVRLLFPITTIATALTIDSHNIGVLNLLNLPNPLTICAGCLLLDLSIYTQHRILHIFPVLWRVHRMHHTDLEFDVTTGVRFHPLEIIVSLLIKIAVIAVLGVPALSVLIFEVLLNATSLFNHGNVCIPVKLDRILRWFIVTPDMHRVHHSVESGETNKNYGFFIPWWDRIFKTYRDQPELEHRTMSVGLSYFRDAQELKIHRLLSQPFRSEHPLHPRTPPTPMP